MAPGKPNRICRGMVCFSHVTDQCKEVKVASRVLCKSGERVTGPVGVHTVKDAKEDSFTAASSGKGAHGADASAHFYKEPLNNVGGAQAFPVGLGTIEEGQEFFQITFQAGNGFWS